ncbi:hypothetical protein [Halopiger goleimassiliensis]|uniref:hypothetical protein n=1 Tax=Halopiger goleimassiliensis TaxID=1293048 RepID=UPI0006777AEC|nr:hypothetical protein [Halopiger goleimassiliensis]
MSADDSSPDEHLKRVRERLQAATESADRPIDTQLNSITAGVYRRNRPSASGLDPEGEGRTLG